MQAGEPHRATAHLARAEVPRGQGLGGPVEGGELVPGVLTQGGGLGTLEADRGALGVVLVVGGVVGRVDQRVDVTLELLQPGRGAPPSGRDLLGQRPLQRWSALT